MRNRLNVKKLFKRKNNYSNIKLYLIIIIIKNFDKLFDFLLFDFLLLENKIKLFNRIFKFNRYRCININKLFKFLLFNHLLFEFLLLRFDKISRKNEISRKFNIKS